MITRQFKCYRLCLKIIIPKEIFEIKIVTIVYDNQQMELSGLSKGSKSYSTDGYYVSSLFNTKQ